MLVHWFLDRYASGEQIEITQASLKCLLDYEWPGNVRELENCIERAVALGNHEKIDVEDLPPGLQAVALPESATVEPSLGGSYASTDLEDIERITIQRVFDQVHGDKELAGRMLGISRATLYRKIKRYNIQIRGRAEEAVSAEAAS
jgi:DNA-binding NtrC family response regulator